MAWRVCAAFGFMDARGHLQQASCLKVLRTLDAEGHIVLPAGKQMAVTNTSRLLEAPVAEAVDLPTTVGGLQDLRIVLVRSRQDRAIWNTLMDGEHPRGVTIFAGAQLKYLYERKSGRFLSGRLLPNPQNSVNLVHRDDAVGIALATIMQNCWGETFNVCADQHPSRAEFYTQAALRLGIALPKVGFDESQPDKVVLNHWVRKRLGYTFKYPDPLTPAP